MSCFAVMCAINYTSHRPLGLAVGACSNHNSVQETHKACLLSSSFPSLLSSFFPSILPSSLLSQVTVWIVWYFKYFEYIRFWNHFWKKKKRIQYIAIYHDLPFTTLQAILVQMRALLSQLIWIHFSNESSWATMLN